MSWLAIIRTIVHFYFNYHYADSTVPYIHSPFSRRVQFALRIVVAFLVGGFLAYGTPLSNQLSQGFLIPLMSVMGVQETFGLTLMASFQLLLGLIPTTIFLFVVQKIGLGYHNYLAAELILLVVSFAIAFVCAQAQNRKIPLVMCAIFFATIVNQSRLPSTFIFQLLEEFVIGLAVGVVVSATVFPVFATIDIENRVNYSLLNLQDMQTLIIQAFLRQGQISAQMGLTRVATIEQMIRTAMSPVPMKLNETRFEPSRCLQFIFNRRRKHLIDWTVQEQEDFVMAWFIHVRLMNSMVKQCQFNEYHRDLTITMEENLLRLASCQSTVITAITTSSSMTKDEFNRHIADLDQASAALRSAYNQSRRQRVEYALESATTIRSDDHLAHAFFIFQLRTIVELLTEVTTGRRQKLTVVKQKRSLKQRLGLNWSRLFTALKCMVIIGVGSIFVMVPGLAKAFENGQWIFIALCMTQGDSVGGAFTTMRMRLFGTLLGAMWSYITYLSVTDNIYQTFGMLVPWILVFAYIRPLVHWGYTSTVAIITPILITLGRIPYGSALPAGNYALLRIEENLVGIGVAMVLTLVIFPVFAIDLLKNNIQTTLQACRTSVTAMRSIYNRLFPHAHGNDVPVDLEREEEKITSFVNAQRRSFHQLVTAQRTLIGHASVEPSFWWFNNNFSASRYTALVQQETDMFHVLYSIETALMCINDFSIENGKRMGDLQMYPLGDHMFTDFYFELNNLTGQLGDCLSLWSSYFSQTQTRFHRLFGHCDCAGTKLVESDLLKHEQHLIEIHETIRRLQGRHQDAIHKILDQYLDRLAQGEPPATFIPYVNNNDADLVFMAISALYFSTTELARTALAMGSSILTIFELETTHRYADY